MKEYYARTMLEAFGGLGCFIAEEIAGRDKSAGKGLGTQAAAVAAVGGADDVF